MSRYTSSHFTAFHYTWQIYDQYLKFYSWGLELLPPHTHMHIDLLVFMCFSCFQFAVQPQNSVPDVVIWMLSDNKRVAVKRIPSHELMYSAVGKCRGKNCGQLQTVYLTVSETTSLYLHGCTCTWDHSCSDCYLCILYKSKFMHTCIYM